MNIRRLVCTLLLVAGIALLAAPVGAATCDVPSTSHPTIQSAVDDAGCAPIVIAAGAYTEAVIIDRTVNLTGAGSDQTFIEGQVQVAEGTVHLAGMRVSAAGEALWSHSGAEVSVFDVVAISGAVQTSLFSDGFEDGTTNGWSGASP
jgi:nitrous oxidase accessory protein NosD